MRGRSNRYNGLFKWWKKAVILVASITLFMPHTMLAAEAGTADMFERLLGGERVFEQQEYTIPSQPTVYLSFDDGPSDLTPLVLEILKREEVPATFFVLGALAEKRGDLVKRIVSEGHALGNHTYNHKYDELYNSFDAFWDQIQKTERILEEAAGIKPTALRAPGGTYGNFDSFYFYYLDRAGYRLYDWNVDSGDAKQRNVPASTIVKNVKNSRLSHEMHVLMHDSTGHAETVIALPEIIKYFKELGYRFAAYDESVKPVVFSQGKPRYSRSYSRTGYERMTAVVEAAAKEKLIVASSAEEEAVRKKGVEVQGKDLSVLTVSSAEPDTTVREGSLQYREAVKSPVLKVFVEDKELEFSSDQYLLENGRLLVPVRRIAELIGGTVKWDVQQRTGNVRYGNASLSIDPNQKQVEITRDGIRQETVPMPDLRFIDGTIYVPLRDFASFLEYRISGDKILAGFREVQLASLGGRSWIPGEREGLKSGSVIGGYVSAWLNVRSYLSTLTTIAAQLSFMFRFT
ncbi:polysaccharide deacetylase [Paenibacillus tarimensis]